MQVIKSAQIHYNEQGTPVSDLFDDVYFSNESGLEETRYVFLQQNGLPERWAQHQASFFHIIETGFGTGLNFLLAWQHFRLHRQQQSAALCQRLYFSSFEKYPLQLADLRQALQSWPALKELAEQLLAQYPLALPGCHRLQFEQGNVTLDLWLGDVHDSMPQLPVQNQADAWFLDGFAPSKNPQMWQPELFQQMARLAKKGTTVATFTSAGLVRRGLQDAGFSVRKIKGYGRKREMTVGIINTQHDNLALANHATAMPAPHQISPEPVTIIGGGPPWRPSAWHWHCNNVVVPLSYCVRIPILPCKPHTTGKVLYIHNYRPAIARYRRYIAMLLLLPAVFTVGCNSNLVLLPIFVVC